MQMSRSCRKWLLIWRTGSGQHHILPLPHTGPASFWNLSKAPEAQLDKDILPTTLFQWFSRQCSVQQKPKVAAVVGDGKRTTVRIQVHPLPPPKCQPGFRAVETPGTRHSLTTLIALPFHSTSVKGRAVVGKDVLHWLLSYTGGPWTLLHTPVTPVSLSAEHSLCFHDGYTGKRKSTL